MVKKKKFKSKFIRFLSNREAQVVGERLDKLTIKNEGELKPTQIVDDARPINSPLHKYFEWDDSIAGEKHRKQQARNLTGWVIEATYVKGTATEQRSFFNVINAKGKSVYVTIGTITKTPDYLIQLINESVEQINSLTNTLGFLKDRLKKK